MVVWPKFIRSMMLRVARFDLEYDLEGKFPLREKISLLGSIVKINGGIRVNDDWLCCFPHGRTPC